jgi:hypothetical protein
MIDVKLTTAPTVAAELRVVAARLTAPDELPTRVSQEGVSALREILLSRRTFADRLAGRRADFWRRAAASVRAETGGGGVVLTFVLLARRPSGGALHKRLARAGAFSQTLPALGVDPADFLPVPEPFHRRLLAAANAGVTRILNAPSRLT